MAESVVSFAVETIGNLLIDEAKFLWGVKGKVEDLQRELRLIRCLLRDADARREHDQAVGEWVAQLRDIAYDAEDVIERYILRVALKKGQNIIKAYACFVGKCTYVQAHVLGTEIEGLKSSISNLRTIMLGHGIQFVNEGQSERGRASMPKRTYAHFEEDIVGREHSIEELVKELKDEKQHRVVSVWGMGGLGKTTIAKKVYTHDEVKNHFNSFAWACISQEYRVSDILEGILVQLIPDRSEEITKMRDDKLLETLYNTQKQERCMVVLDDIWTKRTWEYLRDTFPIKDTRSKLFITTRNKEVAEYIDPHCFLHEPQCLSNQESWELLMKRVFLETKEITEDMKKLGEELLKKCGGLPLAVIVLGGLMAINKWETVYEKINLHFGDNSDVSKVLALSYDNLSWHLKPCFLYLGSFPKGAEIPTMKVLHMWIAEGFASANATDEEREIQVEDVAEQYLMELVNRGMVQARFNLSGKIKTCHLHDLMRDLCVSKATQEGFLSIRNIQLDNEMEDCSSAIATKVESTCKTRRLSLNMPMSDEGNMILSVKRIGRTMLHLRTLMFFGQIEVKRKQFQFIFISSKFLRVLKLEDFHWRSGNLPESVGDLVHLRFLSLERSLFKGLPQSMGNLVCMEFLDLSMSSSITVTMPNILWKMRSLRYLHLPYNFAVKKEFCGDRKKLRLDTLKNIRILKNFCSENCDVKDVGKLVNLQKLTVYCASKLEIIPQLAKFRLKHLQTSSFIIESLLFNEGELSKTSSCHQSCKLSMFGKIEKFPEHNNLPQQLRKLVLTMSGLEEDPMPILEKLQDLVVLELRFGAYMGKEMVCSAGGFPQLKHLVLYDLPNLEELRVAEGAMPHLSRLGISKCPELKTLPRGVHTYDSSDYLNHNLFKYPLARTLKAIRAHAQVLRAAQLHESCESSSRVEKKETKSKGRALDFTLERTISGRTGGEASEESSINLCEEDETSDEGELCNNKVSLPEASEESSTNAA